MAMKVLDELSGWGDVYRVSFVEGLPEAEARFFDRVVGGLRKAGLVLAWYDGRKVVFRLSAAGPRRLIRQGCLLELRLRMRMRGWVADTEEVGLDPFAEDEAVAEYKLDEVLDRLEALDEKVSRIPVRVPKTGSKTGVEAAEVGEEGCQRVKGQIGV
jgi:hypothetical protein